MLDEQFSRSAALLGEEGVARLLSARVAVFGVGGVGGYVCEALARSGVGAMALFDHDVVSRSNLNRQIIALHSTVGRPKVEVMRERILDINPRAEVEANQMFYTPELADSVDLSQYDYIADCIDTVSAKVELICRARAAGVPIISAMGAGNKLDPTRFTVTDLAKTEGCPLARVMRQTLRKRGITHLPVVFSPEPPAQVSLPAEDGRRSTPGSVAFVPSAAGLAMAGEIVRTLAAGVGKA
ncbi:MAG: tRNA threonylcarbamoyladenosine dehydratase [Clostridia bacterium]|nr:tRNA threonylcarbamoyladenosine dehydratase [Clostridia bacterium]